jgi:hypothetical protein
MTKGDLGVISTSLKNTLLSLKQWSQEHFGSVRKYLENLRAQLVDLQASFFVNKLICKLLTLTVVLLKKLS